MQSETRNVLMTVILFSVFAELRRQNPKKLDLELVLC